MQSVHPLDLRSIHSPPNLKDMLRHSSSQNLWLVMHTSPRHYPETLPTLDSLPSGFISPRPLTSLSTFTTRENQRLEKRLGSPLSPINFRRTELPPSQLPNELDYKRVLEKLNRIASHGGSTAHKLVLGDRKIPVEVMLEEEDWLYVKVETKGKPVPLRVYIRTIKGKVNTFVSKTVQEPLEVNCDFVVSGDTAIIRDTFARFRCNYVFLGIFSLEESVVSLRTHFGKLKPVTRLLSSRCDDLDDCDLMALLPSPRPKIHPSNRNFLQENLQTVSSAHFWSGSDDKKLLRASRRQAAKQRFKIQLDLKRTKAMAAVNRGEIRKLEREKQAEILKEKQAKQTNERLLLTLIAFSSISDSLWTQFAYKRNLIQAENLKHKFAGKIQKSFRKCLNGLSMEKYVLLKAGQGLRLMVRCLGPLEEDRTVNRVVGCIRKAGRNARVNESFMEFWEKSKM